ncbi:MAG: hypothetical protein RXS25_36855 [Paraburkholderia sp.]|uniref:hypothetical protein n=1 Tax=Paraburkholderia sp. TaxID=1926495 RepID=UPI00397A5146
MRTALVTVAVMATVASALLASLWVASFFLFASLRLNPFHAGLWGWPDALMAWHDGMMPNGGRRLAGAVLLGVLVAVGGPAMGLLGWPDALMAWHDGMMPNGGRRLAGAVLLGVLVAVGGPAMGLYSLWERSRRRRLYGSARFASEAEIRAAGLL